MVRAGEGHRQHDADQGEEHAAVEAEAFTALCSALLIICDQWLLLLFTTDAEVTRFGERFITLISPFYVTICFNQIFGGALRGVGDAKTPMILMLASFVAFRQLYLYVVTRLLPGAFVPVALAYPMGWVLCSVLMIVCYRRSALCRAEPEPASAA